MKRLGILTTLLLSVAVAQTWYYSVDEDPYLTPNRVDFIPTAEQQACAVIQNPRPANGPLRVDLRPLEESCPGPPVVVWGRAGSEPVYAIELTVKFWGEGLSTDPGTGINALIQILRTWYAFRLETRGRRNRVNVQYHAPFITPPVDAPLNFNSGWERWRRRQDLALEEPRVTDVAQYNESNQNPICADLYRDADACWTARLTWALPVRLVLEGYESGRYRIRVIPDLFYEKETASSLSVREGRLTRRVPKILPAPWARKP